MKANPRLQRPRSTYIEYLEKRIAPATFVVTNLNDSGAGSFRQAVIDANADPRTDTIVFKGAATSGEIALTSGEIAITDSVNIKGPGAGRLIIDAQDLSRIFNINDGTATVKNVSISGLSMVRGSSASEGGGIFSTESLTLMNSVVTGCDSLNDGGGVYVSTSGKVVIRNCTISGNTGGGRGGGLYLGASAGIQMLNSTVSGNSSGQEGGGVYVFIGTNGTGDILIANSTITNNSAAYTGGGILAENGREVRGVVVGKITIRGCTISGNNADIEGGGLYLDNGRVLIERSIISNNVAGDRGGGLGDHRCASLTIRNSQIVNNSTTVANERGGGGAYILGNSNVLIQRTVIASNISADEGGGLVAVESRVTLTSSTISGNTSASAGGGIYAKQGRLNVNGSTIRDNRTLDLGSAGGGISTYGVGTEKQDLRITNAFFTNNRASGAGGAVDARGDGAVDIVRSRFLQNTAGTDGGGLYLRSYLGTISIANSVISRNSAEAGGGLAVRQPGTIPITIISTLIEQNAAANGNGGGVLIFGSGGVVTFKKSTIINNTATIQGGGIRAVPLVGIELGGSKVSGNTAPTDPQIYGVTTT